MARWTALGSVGTLPPMFAFNHTAWAGFFLLAGSPAICSDAQ